MKHDVVVIENDLLSASIAPTLGGTPYGLSHKPTNTQIMTDLGLPANDGWTMGGAPYLFPFAGRVYNDEGQMGRYEIGGNQFSIPIHGFASRMPWKIAGKSKSTASLILKSNQDTLKQFPFTFELTNTFEMVDNQLVLKSSITNLEKNNTMPVSPGWHPFFAIHDSKTTLGIDQVDIFEVCTTGLKGAPLPPNESLSISTTEPMSLIIENPAAARLNLYSSHRITLNPDPAFRVVVLWKPQNSDFICVEPWSRLPNMIRTPLEMIEIAPMQTATFINSISVD